MKLEKYIRIDGKMLGFDNNVYMGRPFATVKMVKNINNTVYIFMIRNQMIIEEYKVLESTFKRTYRNRSYQVLTLIDNKVVGREKYSNNEELRAVTRFLVIGEESGK